MKKNLKVTWLVMLAGLLLAGCQTRHEVAVAPVEVKPIHITIDVNVRIDKALNDFFGKIDAAQEKAPPAAGTD